jgi:hypothetical protein
MLYSAAVFLMVYHGGADSINDRIGADNGTRAQSLVHQQRAARSGAL